MKNERISGIVLDGNNLSWTTVRKGKNGVEIVSSGAAQVEPPEGEEISGGLIAETLRSNGVEASGLAVVGLTSSNMLMKIIKLPTVDAEEIESMVSLQADKLSPFPEDRIAVSFETLFHDESGCSVFIALLPKDAVEAPGALLNGSGFTLHRIDANILAWWYILKGAGEVAVTGRHLILLLSESEPLLIVAQNGYPVAFRFLAGDTSASPADFASELVENISSLLLSVDLENEAVAVSSCDIWSDTDSVNIEISNRIEQDFQIKPELKRLSDLPSLCEGLAKRALLEFPENPRTSKLFKGVGAVIDFLPEKWRILAESRRMKKILAVASAIIVVGWITGLSVFMLMLAMKSAALERAETRQMEIEAASMEVREIRDRVIAFERYLDSSESALEGLREVSALLPPEIDLGGFQYRKGRSLTIRGESLSVNPIYDFKEAMDKSELFGVVTMGTIRPTSRDGATLQTVQISAEIEGDGL